MSEPSTAFPEREVALLSGEKVIVKPWSLKTGRLMRKRLAGLIEQVQAGTAEGMAADLPSLIENFEQDVILIVRDTIGWSDEQMESNKICYEDLVTLAEAIVRVCIIREGGGGIVGKAMGLAKGAGLAGSGIPAVLRDRMEEARKIGRETESEPKPEASPSSPAGGEQTLSD